MAGHRRDDYKGDDRWTIRIPDGQPADPTPEQREGSRKSPEVSPDALAAFFGPDSFSTLPDKPLLVDDLLYIPNSVNISGINTYNFRLIDDGSSYLKFSYINSIDMLKYRISIGIDFDKDTIVGSTNLTAYLTSSDGNIISEEFVIQDNLPGSQYLFYFFDLIELINDNTYYVSLKKQSDFDVTSIYLSILYVV